MLIFAMLVDLFSSFGLVIMILYINIEATCGYRVGSVDAIPESAVAINQTNILSLAQK